MAIKTVVTGATDLSLDASWSGGAKPSAGDTGYLNSGSQTIVTGLEEDTLNRFVITSGFRGKFGTASTPVIMRVANGSAPKMEVEGSTYCNVQAAGTGGITSLIINAPGVPVNLGGSGGTTTTLRGISGSIEVGANAVVTNIVNDGSTINIQDNGTAVTSLVMSSGRCVSRRAVTTWTQDGSSQGLILDDEAITTLNINGDSYFNHQSTGTIGTMNKYGNAMYTPAGALQDTVVTTINNYGRGKLVGRSKQIVLTYTTLNDFAQGGTVVDDSAGLNGEI